MFNLTELGVFDEFFLYDDDKSLANTTLSCSFTKFEFKPMNDYLMKGFGSIPPLRCKITDLFGKQYFKKLSVEEFELFWPKMCVEVENIHTEVDLQKFICSECMQKPIDLINLPPYRIWLLSNYKPNESIILMMGHHSAIDGI